MAECENQLDLDQTPFAVIWVVWRERNAQIFKVQSRDLEKSLGGNSVAALELVAED